MINNPPFFKGLNMRIPIIIPIKGRGFINQGSGLIGITEGLPKDRDNRVLGPKYYNLNS